MDFETVFLSHFCIQKKPDIFELIGAAVQVGAWKHPAEFKKHKDGLLKLLMSNGNPDDEDDEVIDSGIDEIEGDQVMDGDAEIEEGVRTDRGLTEIEKPVAEIEELVQEKSSRFQETCHVQKDNVSKIKSTIEQSGKHLDIDKENKTQGGKYRIIDTSAMGLATNKFTKRSPEMSNMKSAEEKQLIGDCSRHKRLQEGEQLHKRRNCSALKGLKQTTKEKKSHKLGFKKMEADLVRPKHLDCEREKKTDEGTQQTHIQSKNQNATDKKKGSATKQCIAQGSKKRSPMMKMNVAIKRVEVAPPHGNKLLSDCSQQKKLEEGDQQLQKQNNCSNRDLKESWAANDSSKRKFDERVEEINKAKRRAIMVDFHNMPKPPKDPSAPKRCWDRRRF